MKNSKGGVVVIIIIIIVAMMINKNHHKNEGKEAESQNIEAIDNKAEEKEQLDAYKDSSVYSSEYLRYYSDKMNVKIDVPNLEDEVKDIKSEKLMYVKSTMKIFQSDYYAVTKDYTKLFYKGSLKDNKPDGYGMLIEPVSARIFQDSVTNQIVLEITPYNSSGDMYFSIIYAGNFKEGRMQGEGIKFNNYSMECEARGNSSIIDYIIDLKTYEQSKGDIQFIIDQAANPITYIGEFKDCLYNGKGVEYTYPFLGASADVMSYVTEEDKQKLEKYKKEITITSGKFKKGLENGSVIRYELGYLRYKGKMSKGEYNKKGTLYFTTSEQIQYAGEFSYGKYHGTGTEYDQNGTVLYSGKWNCGDYAN